MATQSIRRTKTALVIGGTGKTGRRVVNRLSASGVPIRAGSRSGVVPFDWNDRATWAPAMRDVGSIYISYYPDLAMEGAAEAVEALTDVAVQSGVERLVLLSGRGEAEAQHAEQVVQRSGVEWTVVRCAWFNQNFSENYLLPSILSGEVILPAGTVPEPFLDADDIVDVAVAALTGDGHSGQIYELTGPRLLTFEEAISEIAVAAGRDIAFSSVSVEEYASILESENTPDEVIGLLTYLFAEVLDGRNAYVTDGVQRALGREPTDFTAYAREAAATGVWSIEQ